MTNTRSWVEFILFSFLSLVTLILTAIVELASRVYVHTYVYAVVAFFYLALAFPFLRYNALKIKFAVPCVFLAGLVLLYLSSWTSRKVFQRDLSSIKPGMSVRQVETIMGRYNVFNIGEPNTRISPSGNLVLARSNVAAYRHADANDGEYNGDVGVVKFQNNKVSSIEFQPD